ncbi:RNA 2'-phosphotransferase [Fulvivirga sediminis]|uniref:Probable RNA 2'-phosphotransferase n=1 Tax=Fulvivirga sediminis TaxID=2803949 RepID=A0A937F585_9BACT|nr:RNA 2'-phosphotransferase [Fulvivirga sediminis]MBL3654499.1 RNA 2'-phosphotransferase [Fulvivirga sediminis]
MDSKEAKRISKFLSLVLRHKPEQIDLKLDNAGWAMVEELIEKCNSHSIALDVDKLTEIVDNNDKKRFVFSSDKQKIRANQGHSLQVDLGLEQKEPPVLLYHGTAIRNIDSIKEKGLLKGERHHVHLSAQTDVAMQVGSRYGKATVLTVNTDLMYKDGLLFYQSENGVWLTDYVPPKYIDFKDL